MQKRVYNIIKESSLVAINVMQRLFNVSPTAPMVKDSERVKRLSEHINSSPITDMLERYSSFDDDKAYERLRMRLDGATKSRKSISARLRWISSAAAAVIAVTLYFVYSGNEEQKYSPISQVKEPNINIAIPKGNFKATVINEQGAVTCLDSTVTSVKVGDKIVATNLSESSELNYKAGDRGAESEMNTLRVGGASVYVVTLSDGSRVTLNAGSQLHYPSYFKGGNREVTLQGEAFFEIAHNKDMPFIVKTPREEVRVYGTKFNVKSYDNGSHSGVTLLSGSVGVSVDGENLRLKPNQKLRYDYTDKSVAVLAVDVDRELAWLQNNFDYLDTPFIDVIKDISRWYDVTIDIASAELITLDITLSASKSRDIEHIVDILSRSGDMLFQKTNNGYLVKYNR